MGFLGDRLIAQTLENAVHPFALGPMELILVGLVCLLMVGVPVVVVVVILLATRKGKGASANTMACPDCGGTVSKQIDACPHCGAPVK
jgi:hypothetical protein